MVRFENQCVGCATDSYPCSSKCHNKYVPVLSCDDCGDVVDVLYNDLCEDCYLDSANIVTAEHFAQK